MEFTLGRNSNIKGEILGETLTLKIDLKQNLGPSKSGLSQVIASSRGNRPIPGHKKMRIGLTIFEYQNQREEPPTQLV